MLWTKNKIIGFGIFCSVFVSVFASCASYAIDDISETFSKDSVPSYFFSSYSGLERSSYKYLKVECIPDSGSSCLMTNFSNAIYAFNLFIQSDSSLICSNYVIFPSPNSYYLELCSFGVYDSLVPAFPRFSRARNNLSSNTNSFSIKLTLTNSLPGNECPEPEVPDGSLSITENGTYDVTDYSEAVVNVPQVSETPYDDKLDKLITSVYVIAGTMLVIYFFYCIYRMIIRSTKS